MHRRSRRGSKKRFEGAGRCDFNKKLSGLRLRPCHIVARTCKGHEREWYSATGELAVGHYAMCHSQLQVYLWLKEFTWLTDCSGNIRNKDSRYPPKHVEARWAMEMMQFDYTIVHRPERMMYECNLLSRYNTWTSNARGKDKSTLQPHSGGQEGPHKHTRNNRVYGMSCQLYRSKPNQRSPKSICSGQDIMEWRQT